LSQSVELRQQGRAVVAQLLEQDFPQVLDRSGRFVAKLTHVVDATDSCAAMVTG
jgi:hypothetical protein